MFGAYLTEAPHPAPHYYGTGECFLWRASILTASLPASSLLSSLPPPPSTDTTNLTRSTTIGQPKSSSAQARSPLSPRGPQLQTPNGTSTATATAASSGASTPTRIRFKAFPYSGINDYHIMSESSYFSVGGGDGRYGLWLDDTFERGVSAACLTFGNEPLSDEGEKFDVLGVELWAIGNTA